MGSIERPRRCIDAWPNQTGATSNRCLVCINDLYFSHNLWVLQGLAIACAEFDPVEAESHISRMPVSKSEVVLDGEALESAAMPTLHRREKEVPTAESERSYSSF